MKPHDGYCRSRPPPVLLVMPSFRGGGAEKVFVTLATSLQEGSFPTSIAVISAEGPYARDLPRGIRVHNLSGKTVIRSLPRIIRLLNSSAPSVVLSCMTHLNVVVALAVYLSRVNHRLIVSEHNTYSLEKASMPWPRRLLFDTIVKRAYMLADCVVAVSQGVKDDLVRSLPIPSERIKVIYNPIDVREVQAKGEMASLEMGSFAPYADSDFIVSIGRLVRQKRFDLLIDAFAVVRRSSTKTKSR